MVYIDHWVRLVSHNRKQHIENISVLYNLDDNGKQLVVYMDHEHTIHQIVDLNQVLLSIDQIKSKSISLSFSIRFTWTHAWFTDLCRT